MEKKVKGWIRKEVEGQVRGSREVTVYVQKFLREMSVGECVGL